MKKAMFKWIESVLDLPCLYDLFWRHIKLPSSYLESEKICGVASVRLFHHSLGGNWSIHSIKVIRKEPTTLVSFVKRKIMICDIVYKYYGNNYPYKKVNE